MQRAIGRLRAGGSGFTPLSLFSSGAGIWIDPSDMSTGFTDSAGTTPQTASGQPTGKRNDKSGGSRHLTQTIAGSRPLFIIDGTVYQDEFDGLDDGYITTFAAGTLGASMDIFIALKKYGTGQQVVISDDGAARYAGAMVNGSAALAVEGSGTSWACFVNGLDVGGVNTGTRDQLFDAMTLDTWKIMEIHNVDMTGWDGIRIGLYGSFMLEAAMGGAIVCPSQPSDRRNQTRTWLGQKVGLTL